MSSSAIETWRSDAVHDSDDEPGSSTRVKLLDPANWAQSFDNAYKRLIFEKGRLEWLIAARDQVSTSELSDEQKLDLLRLLTKTFSVYTDPASRNAVLDLGMALAQTPGIAEHLVRWLAHEATTSQDPSSIYVLLTCVCRLYGPIDDPKLVTTLSLLLDSIQSSATAKPALKSGALSSVRRSLAELPSRLPALIASLLVEASKSLKGLPLIGCALHVLHNTKKSPGLPESSKAEILSIYVSLFTSKTSVPAYILDAFTSFVAYYLTSEDFASTILPAVDKGVLRAPEVGLEVTEHLLKTYPYSLSSTSPSTFNRLLSAVLSGSKSSNTHARALSISLFVLLLTRKDLGTTSEDIDHAAKEILATKPASVDHRITLYSLLGLIPPSPSISSPIIRAIFPLVAKETHEGVLKALPALLARHLSTVLQSEEDLLRGSDVVTSVGKELTNVKPAVRRTVWLVVGLAVVGLRDSSPSQSAQSFIKSILPPLLSQAAQAAPTGGDSGPLEGYIAIACLLGPIASLCQAAPPESRPWASEVEQEIKKNVGVLAILSSPTSNKPSFLVSERVWSKLGNGSMDASPVSEDTEGWLLLAVEAAISYFQAPLFRPDGEKARTLLGLPLIHLALHGSNPPIRQRVNDAVKRLLPIMSLVVKDGVYAWLAKSKGGADSTKYASRISALLLSSVSFGDDIDKVDRETKERIVLDLLLASHHELVSPPPPDDSRSKGQNRQHLWISLSLRASVDPFQLINKDGNLEKVLGRITTSAGNLITSAASYRALATLAFIAPKVAIPATGAQIQQDLQYDDVDALTEGDLGIWQTAEGTTYVDVLTATNASQTQKAKGKDAELEKWDADLRKTIASKGRTSAAPALTKAQQALVQAQLEKEAGVRRRIEETKQRLERGLNFIKSLIGIGETAVHLVEEDGVLRRHIDPFCGAILGVTQSVGGIALIGSLAYEVYVALAERCSERLDTFRKWIGIATLRSLRKDIVPPQYQVEPLGGLILRVLHRVRFLSEQSPFDAATFAYSFPLLQFVLSEGGVPTEEPEETLEQVSLALDIVKFHVGDFSDSVFPRRKTLESLLKVIRQQPKLSKDASSTVIDTGGAIHTNATRAEVNVLLQGTLSQEVYVRNSCLQAIQPFDLTDMEWSPELLIACHDDDEQNARLARHAWDDNGLDIPSGFLNTLLPFLGHDHAYVRQSVSAAIAEGVEHWLEGIESTLSTLQDVYRETAKILAPEYDAYGMVIAQSLDRSDPWTTRVSVSRTFELIAPYLPASIVPAFFKCLIEDQALGDRTPEVRKGMLAAGNEVIDLHGGECLADLMAMFEAHLGSSSSGSPTEAEDYIKEAVVILFGRLARHLNDSDPRIPTIVDRLVEALKTPAEQVQIAVSDCLPPLVKVIRPTLNSLVDRLLDSLLNGPKYAVRRGAAYGLAGVLKGTGIAGFKEFGIINRLRAATEDKKRFEPRQGAMFAFETFSYTLGRLFEPYITYVLPMLLACFGDTSTDVREATQDAARVIMGNVSAYGLKLMLPSLLSGLDEKQWRTKKGSIELLGMMAYCSPKQLSISLPIVIPRLTGVLTDSHAQVKSAANKSLKQFGEVINNPEIQALVPVLLRALVDPANTPKALSSLLKTSFMHYIDHSSLALVVPILERGLRERGADTKRKAAQIVGNLASLTDSKDFVPYLDELLPLVHFVLVDPVPEARATAAKALGTLVERLGEGHFPDLVPDLLRTLKTDTSGVDRQGAAQGLSEVLSGLGMERLESLLPDIIANAQSPRATVREGFMSLLVFLPATFGARFQPHLPKIITPILSGLSDKEEYVREAAMKAGRMVITNYSNKAIDLLLPELERGMFDPGWRIRQSSITLVGELLFKVSGISGKTTDLDEDEGAADAGTAETSRRALVEVLGVERRDRILATLYLVRQDGVSQVRLASIQIWKALVHNTPRTVREVLPQIINQLIVLISSDEFEQQEIAGRTIGELCRKFGEKIVGEIMAILRDKMSSQDARTRQGVCLTLCDIMENTTDSQREDHEEEIIGMVRVSLVDDEPNVRSAAAKAFDILQEHIGAQAIDQTIPTLLEALRQPGKGSGTALQALREVMSVRASTVFPVLIPTLTAIPMTVFNARALASLVTVAGDALSKRLSVILKALVTVSEGFKAKPGQDEELKEAVDEALKALLSSIDDSEGLHTLMMVLLGWAKHDTPRRRISALEFFELFSLSASEDLDTSLYRVDWIRQLIHSMDDQVIEVHTAAASTLSAFISSIPKDEYEPLVVPLRRSIDSTGPGAEGVAAGVRGVYVPGFSMTTTKAIGPLVPVIIAGLTTGSHEQRENAAYCISDLVLRTAPDAIKSYVVPFTGPLIRVATQATAYPPAVKSAILSALTTMLEEIGSFVKPFFPQLQRTFVKACSDPSSVAVRVRAGKGLGVLMRSVPRVDPVITELVNGIRTPGATAEVGAGGYDDAIKASLAHALAEVLDNAKENVGEKARESCVEVLTIEFRAGHDDPYNLALAHLFASLSAYPDLVKGIVQSNLVQGSPSSAISAQCILAILSPESSADNSKGNVFRQLGVQRSVAQNVIESAGNQRPDVARPSRESRDVLKALAADGDEDLAGLF